MAKSKLTGSEIVLLYKHYVFNNKYKWIQIMQNWIVSIVFTTVSNLLHPSMIITHSQLSSLTCLFLSILILTFTKWWMVELSSFYRDTYCFPREGLSPLVCLRLRIRVLNFTNWEMAGFVFFHRDISNPSWNQNDTKQNPLKRLNNSESKQSNEFAPFNRVCILQDSYLGDSLGMEFREGVVVGRLTTTTL